MDNPYLPPNQPLSAPTVTSQDSGRAAGLNRADSRFLLISILVVGSTFSQAASLGTSLLITPTPYPESAVGMVKTWLVVNMSAVMFGITGSYRALRRGSMLRPSLLIFFLIYSAAFRFGNVSLGWPWQLHLGIQIGQIGISANLVGLALVGWWTVLLTAAAKRADDADAAARAARATSSGGTTPLGPTPPLISPNSPELR